MRVPFLMGGGWTPAALSPSVWLAPESTAFFSDSGKSAVCADGDAAYWYAAKSPTSIDFSQSTSGNRPVFNTNGGKRWLTFNGSTNTRRMTGTVASDLGSGDFFMAIALRTPATLATDYIPFSIGLYQTGKLRSPYFTVNACGYSVGNALIGSTVAATGSTDYVFSAGKSGSTDSWYLGNTLQYSANTSTTYSATTAYLGVAPGNLYPFSGRIYGAVIVPRTLTTAERALLHTYMLSLMP